MTHHRSTDKIFIQGLVLIEPLWALPPWSTSASIWTGRPAPVELHLEIVDLYPNIIAKVPWFALRNRWRLLSREVFLNTRLLDLLFKAIKVNCLVFSYAHSCLKRIRYLRIVSRHLRIVSRALTWCREVGVSTWALGSFSLRMIHGIYWWLLHYL